LSNAVLLCVPLIDVVLLAATVISVRRGAEPDIWHGLSAAYLGLTVVYGHSTIRWADRKRRRHDLCTYRPHYGTVNTEPYHHATVCVSLLLGWSVTHHVGDHQHRWGATRP
jgi:hypothetical protein